MNPKWRRDLGAKFLTERVQVKDWGRKQAARAAHTTDGVIKRVEKGANCEIDSYEKYAKALGHPLAVWLCDVLMVDAERKLITPEEWRLVLQLRQLEVDERVAAFATIERMLAASPEPLPGESERRNPQTLPDSKKTAHE